MIEKLDQVDCRVVLDAMPSPVFIVDSDLQIIDNNAAATPYLGADAKMVIRNRTGEILNCINAYQKPTRCGESPKCKNCVLRNSVNETSHDHKITRRATRMQLMEDGQPKDVHFLITTSAFNLHSHAFVLLILEDISEFVEMRKLLPMCAWCKNIREDEDYWNSVETYFKQHLDVDITHGLCPDCLKKHFIDNIDAAGGLPGSVP